MKVQSQSNQDLIVNSTGRRSITIKTPSKISAIRLNKTLFLAKFFETNQMKKDKLYFLEFLGYLFLYFY